ncbi:MAG: efflux RND transporter periplasmic adaptor subunit, partial [Terriglobia bacterium]
EVVNKQDGRAFDEDDLFFLESITEQAAIALNNANLLAAERKVRELDALLAISKEITSTLDLDHVLTTVVHQAASVLPFDRCTIGLYDRNRFLLGAVSGESEVPKTREMDQLREQLEWVASQEGPVAADNYDEGWKVDPEEAHQRLVPYLERQEQNGFYAIPLRDDQGTVGVLALESGDAEFLAENHKEVLSILASQTTIAIRNARLYQAVPLMSVWQPLLAKKQKLMAIPGAKWLEWGWKVGLVALVLFVIPWPMRIGANATVVPAERRVVTSEVDGIIQDVKVKEGDVVTAGSVLAVLDSGDYDVLLKRAQANRDEARRQLADAEARRDLGAAARARLQMQMYEGEVKLYQSKVEKATLRAPVPDKEQNSPRQYFVVVTPKVEEKVGEQLQAGDLFCVLVDRSRMAAELNIPETQIDLVQPGNRVALKLNTYPTYTFEGEVERVSAQTIVAEGEQFFVVRAIFTDPEGRFRAGMAGRGKITADGGWPIRGWRPIGYVWLRSPARWAWRKAWTWLP